MFEIIDTPFSSVHTIRLRDSSNFRPCSTGLSIEELKTKVKMENAESSVCVEDDEVLIASAAHYSAETAVQNAQIEAIERVALSAWWAFDRPFIRKLNEKDFYDRVCLGVIDMPKHYSVRIGFVESINTDYWVACSILLNDREYPFAVLGGGCSRDPLSAAKQAFYESIQSWVGTRWMDGNCPPWDKAYWDVSELKRRISSLDSAPDLINKGSGESFVPDNAFNDFSVRITLEGGIYIVGLVTKLIEKNITTELARIAIKDGEKVSVYTPHNI